jgi:hypothetical protein
LTATFHVAEEILYRPPVLPESKPKNRGLKTISLIDVFPCYWQEKSPRYLPILPIFLLMVGASVGGPITIFNAAMNLRRRKVRRGVHQLHQSDPKNPKLGEAYYRLGLSEISRHLPVNALPAINLHAMKLMPDANA